MIEEREAVSVKQETIEDVAARIANMCPTRTDADTARRKRVEVAVIEALRNKREACAKVADKYIADMKSVKQRTEYGEGCLNAAVYIDAAIREGR